MRQLSAVLVFSFVASVCVALPAAAADVVLRPPTEAPVLDPFRLPDGPYAAGNRGIEYATRSGDPVRAAGPGIVVFAGPVAGSLHVTVDHGHGLRTSYSFVAAITVRRGDTVDAGTLVARAGGPVHFGARIDGAYVDPAGLFGVRHVSVVLVPHDDPAVRGRWLDIQERSERLQYRVLFGEGGGFGLGNVVGAVREVIAAAAPLDPGVWVDTAQALEDLVRLVDVATTLAVDLSPDQLVSTMTDVAMAAFWPPPCTPVGSAVSRPAVRRIAVVINGLGSSSGDGEAMAQLDLGDHGYAPADTVRFSYNGGIVDDGHRAGWQAPVPATSYDSADTLGHAEDYVDRLEATLRAVGDANPGVPIDVYGHSLGGLVARHAIAAVGGDAGSVEIGVAVTLASPHSGTPTALALEAFAVTHSGQATDAVLDVAWPDNLLDTPIVEDLSRAGFAGDTADVAFPLGVHAVSIADRGDLVVPASVARTPGAHHVTLGDAPSLTAHSDLPGLDAVDREIRLAIAGLAPTCEGIGDRVADVVQPAVIQHVETQVGAAVLVGGLALGGP